MLKELRGVQRVESGLRMIVVINHSPEDNCVGNGKNFSRSQHFFKPAFLICLGKKAKKSCSTLH